MTHLAQHPENDGKVANYATRAEADAASAMCYPNHMAAHNDNPTYTAQTTDWCAPFQRLDGSWDIFVCHHTDVSGADNVSEYDESDYTNTPRQQ